MKQTIISLFAISTLGLSACALGDDDALLVDRDDFQVETGTPADGITTISTIASGGGSYVADLVPFVSNGGSMFGWPTVDGDEWSDVGITFAPHDGAVALTKSGNCLGSQNASPTNNWGGTMRLTFHDPITGQPALAENVSIGLVNPPITVNAYDESGALLSSQTLSGFSGTVTVNQVGIHHIDISGGFYCLQNSVSYDLAPACDEAPVAEVHTPVTYLDKDWLWHTFNLSDCASIVSDDCDASLDIDAYGHITQITSDEQSVGWNNHDCDAEPEYCREMGILSNGSGEVRKVRDSYGDGRVYTVHFTVSDSQGNESAEYTCDYAVRLYGGQAPVDSGDECVLSDGDTYAVCN